MFKNNWKAKYAINFAQTRKADDSYWHELWTGISKGKHLLNLLDIGCGDAKFFSWIEKNGFKVQCIGIDNSIAMLSLAKQQCKKSSFVLGNAKHLPFLPESFEGLILSNTIHYIGIDKEFVNELLRVLKPLGRLIIGVANVHEIMNYWEYEFFPSALRIDTERMPTIESISQRAAESGFNHIYSERVVLEKRIFGIDFVNRVKKKHMSSLWLIPQHEFDNGIRKMEEEIPKRKMQKQNAYLHVLVFEKP